MNFTFTPAADVPWGLPGAWLLLLILFGLAYIVARTFSNSLSQRRVAFLVLASLIVYFGFEWSIHGFWWNIIRIAYWLFVIVTAILWVFNRVEKLGFHDGRLTAERKWGLARTLSVLALVLSILLASNFSFGRGLSFRAAGLVDVSTDGISVPTPWKSQEEKDFDKLWEANQQKAIEANEQNIHELREDLVPQIESMQVDNTSVDTECKSFPGICAELKAHDKDISTLKKDVEQLKKDVNQLQKLVTLPDSIDPEAVADSLARSTGPQGWRPGEVLTGEAIIWSQNGYDAGNLAFVPQPVNTPERYGKFLSDNRGVRKRVFNNTPDEIHKDLLKGKSMIYVQLAGDSCVEGNTGLDGDEIVVLGRQCHDPGDIWAVPVGRDGTVYWTAAIRVDCGNPGAYAAPFPKYRPAPAVCPEGTDRAGQPFDRNCDNPPRSSNPRQTPPQHTTPATPDQPEASTPPESPAPTTPPVSSTPHMVLVCINNGGDTKEVPESEAWKYPKPHADGTCAKYTPSDPANGGNSGNGSEPNENTGTGATTTPTQPAGGTTRPAPAQPTDEPTSAEPTEGPPATAEPTDYPSPQPTGATDPTDPANACSPYLGRTCP